MERHLNVLLLCDYQPRIAATVRDHIRALEGRSRHRWYRLSMLGDIPESIDLDRFDVVVVHYTLVACNEFFLSARSRARLNASRALKAMFIQDEYRHVDASVDAMSAIGVRLLFTCVPTEEIEKVYPEDRLPGVRKENVLTGYVPEALLGIKVPPPSLRRLLVGYRGRKLPAWLGDLGQEKLRIGLRFAEDARRYPDLACDISFREEDRLYGKRWTQFMIRCRAMLGVESGASVFDFSGNLQRAVDQDALANPALGYEELKRRHFQDLDGRIRLAQISPRCFESAALRTIMVLYPGDYSGRLLPWRHYVPLDKDHSNLDEVVNFLRDGARCDQMAEVAYREVAMAPQNSYDHFAGQVDDAMAAVVGAAEHSETNPYGAVEFRRALVRNLNTLKPRAMRFALTYAHLFLFRVLLGWASPVVRDRVHRRIKWLYHVITFRRWRLARR